MTQKNLTLSATFLEKLQQEAQLQAKLEKKRLIPPQLDWLGNLVCHYPWQTLLAVSFVTSAVFYLTK